MNENQPDELKCYTLAEASEMLSVSTTTVLKLISNGKLRAFKSGHGWRISRGALNDYVASQEALIQKK